MSADAIPLADSGPLVLELVKAINENRALLSEIDGAIGDGDHGINMSKGFSRAGNQMGAAADGLAAALRTLGETLLEGIGGSMGPLYGTFFLDMAAAVGGADLLDAALFSKMLRAGLEGVQGLGAAKPGDKTMLDALLPALAAFDASTARGCGFAASLRALSAAAEEGRDSTRDMVARVGRAARLGERSRGTIDAGAASCCLILTTLAEGVLRRLA